MNWIKIGALSGFLCVAVGAFGAHGLKARLEKLGTAAAFETGVRYHAYHVLALLTVGILVFVSRGDPSPWLHRAGWAFLAGTLVFSGSLYALAMSGAKILGAITPLGGLLLLAGWVFLTLGAPNR